MAEAHQSDAAMGAAGDLHEFAVQRVEGFVERPARRAKLLDQGGELTGDLNRQPFGEIEKAAVGLGRAGLCRQLAIDMGLAGAAIDEEALIVGSEQRETLAGIVRQFRDLRSKRFVLVDEPRTVAHQIDCADHRGADQDRDQRHERHRDRVFNDPRGTVQPLRGRDGRKE